MLTGQTLVEGGSEVPAGPRGGSCLRLGRGPSSVQGAARTWSRVLGWGAILV